MNTYDKLSGLSAINHSDQFVHKLFYGFEIALSEYLYLRHPSAHNSLTTNHWGIIDHFNEHLPVAECGIVMKAKRAAFS